MLNIIDEFIFECLAIEFDHYVDADHVVEVLDRLKPERSGPSTFILLDNGPELVAHALADRCRFNDTASMFIDSGSPWEYAWIESLNGRSRDELLNGWQFNSLLEARVNIEDSRID